MIILKDLLKRLTNKRILIASSMVAIAIAITIGATGAFFADDETSRDNIFSAGAIDLQIDNESYYNGELQENLSWELRDLTVEKFFDFPDLKPGDEGEDTISIHVGTNDAWVCMDVDLTAMGENEITEPEGEDGDVTEDEGELQNFINFVWWPDDGDNVLEDDEAPLAVLSGTLGDLDDVSLALADASGEAVFGDEPLPADSVNYIAKAWCYGELTLEPLIQDIGDNGRSPADPEGAGVLCDGEEVDNTSQTDSVVGDITFTAIQSRNNLEFTCDGEVVPPPPTATSTLTIIKTLINNDGGTGTTTDFAFTLNGGSPVAFEADGSNVLIVASGTTTVAEVATTTYASVIGGDCDPITGEVLIAEGGSASCTITNDDNEPDQQTTGNIIIAKVAENGADTEFGFTSDYGSPFTLQDGESNDSGQMAAGTYSVAEDDPPAGWILDTATCDDGSDPGSIDLSAGETVTCTFTNVEAGTIIVAKVATGGEDVDFDFTSDFAGAFILQGGESSNSGGHTAGIYSVSEAAETGWTLDSATCDDGSDPSSIDLAVGETVTCTFTNVVE